MLPFPIISNLNKIVYVQKIQTGSNHYSTLTSTGNLFSIGTNTNYQMGDNTLNAVYSTWKLIDSGVSNFWCFSSGTVYVKSDVVYFSGLPTGVSTVFGSTAVLKKELSLPSGYVGSDIVDMQYEAFSSWYGMIMKDGTYWYLYNTSTDWVNSSLANKVTRFFHVSRSAVSIINDVLLSSVYTHAIGNKTTPVLYSPIGNMQFFMVYGNDFTSHQYRSASTSNDASQRSQLWLYTSNGSSPATISGIINNLRFHPMQVDVKLSNSTNNRILISSNGLQYSGAASFIFPSTPIAFHSNGNNRVILLQNNVMIFLGMFDTSYTTLSKVGLS